MISKVKVRDDNKLSYNAVLHHEKITEEYFKVVGNYKFKYIDKQIFSTYNSTTEKYNIIINKYNYLWGNKKCVDLNDDCIFYILTFLDALDVVNCSLVSKRFYGISRSELLWKRLFNYVFCHVKYENNFYDNYKKHIRLDIDIVIGKIISGKKTNAILYDFEDITYLSPQIGSLNNLQILSLRANRLQYIPVELFNLINLKHLDFSCNKLKFIQSEIGHLVKLTELQINNNELKIIPPEIGNLKYLKELAIYHNQTQIIPPELGKLKKLKILKLTNEQFENRPMEIKKLKKLGCYVYDDEWKWITI